MLAAQFYAVPCEKYRYWRWSTCQPPSWNQDPAPGTPEDPLGTKSPCSSGHLVNHIWGVEGRGSEIAPKMEEKEPEPMENLGLYTNPNLGSGHPTKKILSTPSVPGTRGWLWWFWGSRQRLRPPEVLAWSSPQFLPPGCSRASSSSIRQSNRTFHSPRFPWPHQSRCSVDEEDFQLTGPNLPTKHV